MSTLSNTTRRALLQKISALSLAPVATPLALNLLGMANASAQSATDYKALVCVFLFGGNDHNNTVIPFDPASHALYSTARNGVAISRDAIINAGTALTSTATGLASGLQMALAPTMGGLKSVFDKGHASILLNVGPLVVPTTLAEFKQRGWPLPPKLFSHSNQQAYWQSAGGLGGWGGRTADLILSGNEPRAALTSISVNGNARFSSGKVAKSYQISSSGAKTLNALAANNLFSSSACADALRTLVRTSNPNAHMMELEYAQTMARTLDLYGDINTALTAAPEAQTPFNLFSTASSNTLSQQLRVVARLLHQRNALGLKRQVFLVGLGGFDHHGGLVSRHPALIGRVSAALKEFNDVLLAMGLHNQVTTFTASDFGRTLASNGNGSDHGWGGHQFVMGGAVNGGRFFGTAPPIGLDHNQQVGSGRLLPSTSIDQMAAQLARWFGVSNADLGTVLPNAKYFNTTNFALMKS